MNKQSALIPVVVEQTTLGERSFDLFSRLMRERIIFLNTQVSEESAQIVVSQLIFLDSESKTKPIYLYINSPGGSVVAGLSIYDTMNSITAPVHTICTGMAASMGAFLLSSGDKRSVLPNATVMIHQPSGGSRGQATDMNIVNEDIQHTKRLLSSIIAVNSNQPYQKVLQDCERDYYMTAHEALEYGLIDEILTVQSPESRKGKRYDIQKDQLDNISRGGTGDTDLSQVLNRYNPYTSRWDENLVIRKLESYQNTPTKKRTTAKRTTTKPTTTKQPAANRTTKKV